jgi:hypothetical protein
LYRRKSAFFRKPFDKTGRIGHFTFCFLEQFGVAGGGRREADFARVSKSS